MTSTVKDTDDMNFDTKLLFLEYLKEILNKEKKQL